ncbi:MAG: glycogen/starch/alpha-glucan phosphorylase [Patescibacteria group bacterium]
MDNEKWFEQFRKEKVYTEFKEKPVAYFCAEYALDSALPTYAGGLGVLAGDYVREAARQGFPLLAVGLYYKEGQSILAGKAPIGNLKKVSAQAELVIEERMVTIGAWEWQEGDARVYLLDTDLPANDPIDRDITKKLYDMNRDLRLKQEIILGLGGFRMLKALGFHPGVYHLNESHSALIALELVRHEMEHQLADFALALGYANKHIVFTNHTLLPEGLELFAEDKVGLFLEQYAEEMGLAGKDISLLGWRPDMPSLLSMTALALRLSSRANAVSRLHAEKAKVLWPEEKLESITNGIYLPRWDKTGEREIDLAHKENKKKLLAFVKEKTGEAWEEGDLVLSWARRFVEYKQPTLLLDHADEILRIAKSSSVPIRLIFSGPTSEDENGNPYVAKIKKIIEGKLRGTAVFLPNWSTDLAEMLVAGSDIWLNTPVPGYEACGTSGMKAALNGVLALTTRDGWVAEVEPADIGWVVDDPRSAAALLLTLEREIVPAYRDKAEWRKKMESARETILKNFSTARVLREYIEKLYIPTLREKHSHLA